MDKLNDQLPVQSLIAKVKEALEAGLSTMEGAELIGMYDDGYREIVKLIFIAENNDDPRIRERAQKFLDEVDKAGAIGVHYLPICQFTRVFLPKRSRLRTTKMIRGRERERLERLVKSLRMKKEDQVDAERILDVMSSDNEMSKVDYEKVKGLFDKYRKMKVTQRVRLLEPPNVRRLEAFAERLDVEEGDKRAAAKLLSERNDDGRLKLEDYVVAIDLIAKNKANKEQRQKRIAQSSNFENAVLVACQACENLSDLTMPVIQERERKKMMSRLCSSAAVLLRIQAKLMENYDDE
jgi:hypothetical protein